MYADCVPPRKKPSPTLMRVAAMGAALLLGACQPDQLLQSGSGTSTAVPASANPDGVSYSMFFSQGQHVDQLAKAERWDDVAKVFALNRAFFDANRMERHAPALSAAAENLNAARSPALAALQARLAAGNPASTADWPDLRAAMREADAALRDYDAVPLLAEPRYRAAEAEALRSAAQAADARSRAAIAGAFASYDHLGAQPFFANYPLSVDAPNVFAANFPAIEARLAAAPRERLLEFAKAAREAGVLNETTQERLANMLLAAYSGPAGAAAGQRRDLRTLVAGVAAVRAAGFEPKKIEGATVGFVQATSQTLLRQGQIEFPAEVTVDMPFEAKRLDLDKALEDPIAQTADFLIVFDVALARATRRVGGMDPIRSRYVADMRREPNPDFEIRRIEVTNSQMAHQQARMQSSLNSMRTNASPLAGLFQGIADAASTASARGKVDEAMKRLQETPQFVDVPVYADYTYNQARVQGARAMTVNYYVIDRRAQTYVKSTFDVTENQDFRVNYNVHDRDPNAAGIRGSAHKEDDVADWEKSPMVVKLSQLVDHYVKNTAREQRLVSPVALRDEMLRDKNTALAAVQANRVEPTARTDQRMESVVAIFLGRGSMGSGFYVTPDIVMTNYHVVRESRLVEMRLWNGQETFGRVEASDVRLDLALIRVQNRGKPVQFFDGSRLDLGTQIDVLGHPDGNLFSLSRGVVSAVRQGASVNSVGGKPYLQLQYDAASSPGNSGGPIFMADKVVAVVSYASLGERRTNQNLNFGIHYREVLEWLREKNIQVAVQR